MFRSNLPLRRLVAAACLSLLAGCAGTPAAPPATRHADVNGAKLAYVEQGRGTPIVFLHGAVSDHRYWDRWRDAIAQQHRFIALTQRHFGAAGAPSGGPKFSLGQHADDVAAFIRHLDAGPVVLVGHSYGGTVALATAALHGDLVRAVFVNEPGLRSLVSDPAEQKAVGDDGAKSLGPVIAAVKEGDNAKAARALLDGVNDQPGTFDRASPATQQMLLDNAHTLPVMFGAAPPPSIGCEQLQRYPGPALVARGELTRPFFRLQSDAALRCLRRGQALVVPQGRHSWPSAEPELYRRALLDFVASL